MSVFACRRLRQELGIEQKGPKRESVPGANGRNDRMLLHGGETILRDTGLAYVLNQVSGAELLGVPNSVALLTHGDLAEFKHHAQFMGLAYRVTVERIAVKQAVRGDDTSVELVRRNG